MRHEQFVQQFQYYTVSPSHKTVLHKQKDTEFKPEVKTLKTGSMLSKHYSVSFSKSYLEKTPGRSGMRKLQAVNKDNG